MALSCLQLNLNFLLSRHRGVYPSQGRTSPPFSNCASSHPLACRSPERVGSRPCGPLDEYSFGVPIHPHRPATRSRRAFSVTFHHVGSRLQFKRHNSMMMSSLKSCATGSRTGEDHVRCSLVGQTSFYPPSHLIPNASTQTSTPHELRNY